MRASVSAQRDVIARTGAKRRPMSAKRRAEPIDVELAEFDARRAGVGGGGNDDDDDDNNDNDDDDVFPMQ